MPTCKRCLTSLWQARVSRALKREAARERLCGNHKPTARQFSPNSGKPKWPNVACPDQGRYSRLALRRLPDVACGPCRRIGRYGLHRSALRPQQQQRRLDSSQGGRPRSPFPATLIHRRQGQSPTMARKPTNSCGHPSRLEANPSTGRLAAAAAAAAAVPITVRPWSLWLDEVIPFKMCVVWDKGGLGMGWHYRRCWECILVAEKPGAACKWNGGNDVPNANTENRQDYPECESAPHRETRGACRVVHSPSLATGRLVLEPFLGGGLTFIGAERLGRLCIGCEPPGPIRYRPSACRRFRPIPGPIRREFSTIAPLNFPPLQ